MASSSDIESNRSDLSGSGELARAVLYNNPKDAATALSRAGLGFVPTGTISAFAGTTLPSGYLWCDGAPQLISLYPGLYAVLGASRYSPDTATQFYTPNLTSHLPRGAATTSGAVATNNNNTSNHSVNATSATVNACTTNNDGGHGHSTNGASTIDQGGHNHNINGTTTTGGANGNAAVGNTVTKSNASHQHTVSGQSTADTGGHNHNINGANTISTGVHNHGLTAGAVTVTSGTINNAAYVPAFVEVNYIIKT